VKVVAVKGGTTLKETIPGRSWNQMNDRPVLYSDVLSERTTLLPQLQEYLWSVLTLPRNAEVSFVRACLNLQHPVRGGWARPRSLMHPGRGHEV